MLQALISHFHFIFGVLEPNQTDHNTGWYTYLFCFHGENYFTQIGKANNCQFAQNLKYRR